MLHVPANDSNIPQARLAVCPIMPDLGHTLMLLTFHVLNDLEPYQCMESYCLGPNVTYGRLSHLHNHSSKVHPSAPIITSSLWTCVFCTESLSGTERDKFRHVARHMEEMAFSIVPRQYEHWDFYTDCGSREEGLTGRPEEPAGPPDPEVATLSAEKVVGRHFTNRPQNYRRPSYPRE